MSDPIHWNDRYGKGDTPWDSGHPSSELQRVLAEAAIQPCRALEPGCGTGASAIWLSQQGFDVTAFDLSPLAIGRAQRRAEDAGVTVRFLVADVLRPPPDLSGPFDFFFDRGCYHVVRREDPGAYLDTLRRLTRPDTRGLVLAGNAREPHDPGPPVVTEEQIRAELGSLFEIVHLREFRFDQVEAVGIHFLGWSCRLQRPAGT
jgi:SAM-dependent methyltransferase